MLITDGYSREQFLDLPGRAPVRILYRPMLGAERKRLALQTVRLANRGTAGREAAARLAVVATASRLIEWDLAGPDGIPIEISTESVGALDPALFEAVHSAVTRFDDEGASAKN